MAKLSEAQEKRLNRLYLSGDISGGRWETVQSLLDRGMVAESGGKIVLTEKGRRYCAERGVAMPV